MPVTPEGKIKDLVKRVLRRYNVYWHMPVQNGLGAPSLDFVCCCNSKYFAIETKAPGKKPTVRQLKTISDIKFARGKVFVIDGDVGLEELERWLEEVDNNVGIP